VGNFEKHVLSIDLDENVPFNCGQYLEAQRGEGDYFVKGEAMGGESLNKTLEAFKALDRKE